MFILSWWELFQIEVIYLIKSFPDTDKALVVTPHLDKQSNMIIP